MASDAIPTRRALREGGSAAAAPTSAGAGGRGRHASGTGEGLGRLLTWTTLGAVVPGLSHLAAGRRRTAAVLLGLVALTVAALVALVASGRLLDLGFKLAVRPDALLAIAVTAGVGGLLWAVVIVTGHRALRRHRLRPSQNLLSTLLVLALVTAVLVPAGTVARYAMAQRSVVLNVFGPAGGPRGEGLAGPDLRQKDPWAGTPRVNVLLIGSDAAENREGTRPDTLIVASIDTATGDTVLFNLPRHLQNVPFPPGTPAARQWPDGFDCGNQCLINAVWSWAEANPELYPGTTEPGLTATRDVVSETLGLQIDYYALVNMRGFMDLVDAMGGLELNVTSRVPIGSTGEVPKGYIEPGRRVLNGYDALWFARSRADGDNYTRMRRQQCVIGAASEQMDPIELAMAFPKLAASAQENVRTDIPADHLDAFVTLGQRVKAADVRSLPFTADVIVPANPDFDAIRALVDDALEPPEPAPATSAPSPSPSPSEQPSQPTPGATDPTTTPPPDPQRAQDIDEVCG